MDAIHRFVARWGSPITNVSDIDISFVGAALELCVLLATAIEAELKKDAAKMCTKWTLNPAGALHLFT